MTAGATFDTPVSVAGSLNYFPLTTGTNNSFSTLDLEVESGGNPHIAYAILSSASDRSGYQNVLYSHSEDGGVTWETPLIVNDVTAIVGNTQGRSTAFPRTAIDDRDNIFVSYIRGTSKTGTTDDVMLAKVNRRTSPFTMIPIGSLGTAGSSGGVRLTDDAKRHTGNDIAIGDGDALHVVFFSDGDNEIQHKRMNTDTTWADVSGSGWDQNADGAVVGAFVDEVTNTAVEQETAYFFPSIVVDRQRLPDRVYALYKGGSAGDEGVFFSQYSDDGTTGTAISWGTAAAVWSTGGTPLFDDGTDAYGVELDWTITERIAAVVDDRLEDRGVLHIAFSAGHSGGISEHDIFYASYTGTSWTPAGEGRRR